MTTFVLVEPREAGNVGMIARAMANFGLSRLVIVGAAERPDRTDLVIATASGRRVLEEIRHAPDLRKALAPFHAAIAVSRRTGKHRPADLSPADLHDFLLTLPPGSATAFVFGREADGLKAEEVLLCGRLLRIPTVPEAPSLNLAQAATIVAFTLFAGIPASPAGRPPLPGNPLANRAGRLSRPGGPPSPDLPASQASLESMFRALEAALGSTGFLQGDRGVDAMASLRRLIGRAVPSEREVRLLRSLARKIGKG